MKKEDVPKKVLEYAEHCIDTKIQYPGEFSPEDVESLRKAHQEAYKSFKKAQAMLNETTDLQKEIKAWLDSLE